MEYPTLSCSVEKLPAPIEQRQFPDVAQGRKNPLWMGLPDRLSRLRKRTGLSMRQVARCADTTHRTLALIEAGLNVPGIDLAEKLASALGVPLVWFVFGPEGDEPFQPKRRRPRSLKDDPEPRPGQGTFAGRHAGCGARLREAREQQGKSARQVAKDAEHRVTTTKVSNRLVSYQAVLYAEAGAIVPQVDTIEAIAGVLGVAPGWLAYGDDPE